MKERTLMDAYTESLLSYFWIWALCHTFGGLAGFILLETPYGVSTLREKLVRSLQTSMLLFTILGAIFSATFDSHHRIDNLKIFGIYLLVGCLPLVLARITHRSTLD